MVNMVDSRDRKLGKVQIVAIALQNTDSKYPANVAFPAIISEMSQPNAKTPRFGNTIFIIHIKDTGGYFRAFNADIAQNFVMNSILFLRWARAQGLKTLVTDFNDPNIYRMIQRIGTKEPMPNMGYEAHNLKDGGMRVAINLGKGK